MAKHTGCEVLNLSRGGMTAKEYVESFAETNGYWDRDKACQAYIIALGVNDLLNGNRELGTVRDAFDTCDGKSEKSVAGYYGEIIRKLKEIMLKKMQCT